MSREELPTEGGFAGAYITKEMLQHTGHGRGGEGRVLQLHSLSDPSKYILLSSLLIVH